MASGSKSQEDEGPEAYFEAALTFFPSTSSNPDGSLSTLELQDVDKQRGATTADMLLADGPSMEVPVQDLPEISPPTKDPTKEDIERLADELETLKRDDGELEEKHKETEMELARLKLLVEEEQSKQRLRSLAKHKAKLRKPEEIDALFGDS